jgi:hypothetical protein
MVHLMRTLGPPRKMPTQTPADASRQSREGGFDRVPAHCIVLLEHGCSTFSLR